MKFDFLTFPEVASATIAWNDDGDKSHELVMAALAAGFSKWEVDESPLGLLECDLEVAGFVFKAGARALIGMNGSTLIEVV